MVTWIVLLSIAGLGAEVGSLAEPYPVPDEPPQRLGEGHPVWIIIIQVRLIQLSQQVGMATLPKRRLHRVVRGPEVGDQDALEDLGKELL